MTSHETILAHLTRLLETSALPRSACSAALLKTLQPLLQAGVLAEERSGAGRRLVVHNPAALQEFIHHHFPQAQVAADAPTRLAGVAAFRNSKALAADTPEIVSVRAWSEAALLSNGQETGAAAATARHGVFSFVLHTRYALHGNVALVENPAVFLHFERLRLPADLVIYGHGRASSRLLDWLSSMAAPDFSLLHLPDYDPVGLSEFDRLRSRLGPRARLHLPLDLVARFARFANPALLANPGARAMLAVLRSSASSDVRQVVALIDRHNAALEQEALLLTP